MRLRSNHRLNYGVEMVGPVKPHHLIHREGSIHTAECMDCGELMSIPLHEIDRQLPLLLTQLIHQIDILQRAATNRKP